MAELNSDNEKCIGCGMCMKGLPTKDQKINCSKLGIVDERQSCPDFVEFITPDPNFSLKNFRID